MTLESLLISGAFISNHRVFPDERGIFREWFKADEIAQVDSQFVVRQANYSKSKKHVIRGMHYSVAPQGQAKVVTCSSGSIVDVLVDLRLGSPTYLKIDYVELSEDSGKVVFIPSGVGHGFMVGGESASIVYLTSSGYAPQFEKAICPTDPELGINWPLPNGVSPIISRQDLEAPNLSQASGSGGLPLFFT